MMAAGCPFCGRVERGEFGDQPDYAYVVRRFPSARHLSIALDPAAEADCLDIENGAATPGSAAAWFGRQKARGIARPALYASASLMQSAVVPIITAARRSHDWPGHPPPAVRLAAVDRMSRGTGLAPFRGRYACRHAAVSTG